MVDPMKPLGTRGMRMPPPERPRRPADDELEQAQVALEDAQGEVATLARERDALAAKLRLAEAALAEERRRGVRREAAVGVTRRRV